MSRAGIDRSPRSARLTALLRGDFKRGAAASFMACGLLVPLEYGIALLFAPGTVEPATALRFAALSLALISLLSIPLALVVGLVSICARLGLAVGSTRRATEWLGILVSARRGPADRASPAAAWIWALVIGAGGYVAGSYFMTRLFTTTFKAPQVVALVLGGIQLGIFAVVVLVAYLVSRGTGVLGRLLHRPLRWVNPFGRPPAALVMIGALAVVGVWLLLKAMPQLRGVIPWRHIADAGLFLLGLWQAPRILGAARRALLRLRIRRLGAVLSIIAALLILNCVAALWLIGAHPGTKYLAVTASPPLGSVVSLVRLANDFDGDGYGSLLGENDCAPFDAAIHPAARDIPDNGIDENCNGRDFSLANRPSYRQGERMPVPPSFRRLWNILFVTIDDLRYDHTGFGGYLKKTGRDLTPNLDELVARSTSFTFNNTPSAGTMASVPAILTSKFFHSGIALNEGERMKIYKLIDASNVLMAEVMKRGRYHTGAIVTHEYLNNGHDQGFDDYDFELASRGARGTSAAEVTDKAVAWIAKNADKKWFLWLHYLDPHGFYVRHPGYDYGPRQMDLYDGEIAYTDTHFGRLLRELPRIPGNDRTVIIITADHGDGFGEHGLINHGMALYREMVNVPLIFYIPDLEPKTVDGAVSPIDVLPTLADLCDIEVSDLSFEGESLVPQLFYSRDAHHRVVFSETNFQRTLRAAITSNYKLIYNLKAHTFELFDLRRDPWEKHNIWNRDKTGGAMMRRYLDDWLERVYYSRNVAMNQAALARSKYLLTKAPKPQHRADAAFEGGAIRVLGFDLDKESYRPGDSVRASVFFKVVRNPSARYRLQLKAWPASRSSGRPKKKPPKPFPAFGLARYTAEGLFSTERWRAGERIRDELEVKLPASWTAGRVKLGLRMLGEGGRHAPVTGEVEDDDPHSVVIGTLELKEKGPPPLKTKGPAPRKARLLPAVRIPRAK